MYSVSFRFRCATGEPSGNTYGACHSHRAWLGRWGTTYATTCLPPAASSYARTTVSRTPRWSRMSIEDMHADVGQRAAERQGAGLRDRQLGPDLVRQHADGGLRGTVVIVDLAARRQNPQPG